MKINLWVKYLERYKEVNFQKVLNPFFSKLTHLFIYFVTHQQIEIKLIFQVYFSKVFNSLCHEIDIK